MPVPLLAAVTGHLTLEIWDKTQQLSSVRILSGSHLPHGPEYKPSHRRMSQWAGVHTPDISADYPNLVKGSNLSRKGQKMATLQRNRRKNGQNGQIFREKGDER